MTNEELIVKLRHRKNTEGYSYLLDKEQCDICIGALEKQVGKKTIKQSTDEKTHYKCVCGYIHMTVYKEDGFRLGRITKYCECCGQKVDESEVE